MLIQWAGGIKYHFRALKYRRTLWDPFRKELDPIFRSLYQSWISQRTSSESRLIIIGPSGGYAVPQNFISHFSEIIFIDPDPLSFPIFSLLHQKPSHPQKRIWLRTEKIFQQDGNWNVDWKNSLKQRYPGALWLFSNILGQHKFLYPQNNSREILAKFKKVFTGIDTVSFHDRFSGEIKPILPERPHLLPHLSDKEIIEKFYPAGTGVLLDHETSSLGFNYCIYLSWEIVPEYFHLIEFSSSFCKNIDPKQT